jgi:hypothetical protein
MSKSSGCGFKIAKLMHISLFRYEMDIYKLLIAFLFNLSSRERCLTKKGRDSM